MNAITYDGVEHYRYIWYTRKEIRQRAKARAFANGSNSLIIDYGADTEVYELHGTRWFKL